MTARRTIALSQRSAEQLERMAAATGKPEEELLSDAIDVAYRGTPRVWQFEPEERSPSMTSSLETLSEMIAALPGPGLTDEEIDQRIRDIRGSY